VISGRPGLPFARLVRLEGRKVVDTRSGRWLLGSIALLAAAAVGLAVCFADVEELRFPFLVAITGVVLTLLFPVLGILTVTAELSQRTGLVTFTTEPRRSRVALAKLIAASGWAFVGLGAAVVLAAAAHAVAVLARDVPADWSPDWASVGGLALNLVLGVTQGVAFGLLLAAPAAAVTAYLVLPTLWALVANLAAGLQRVAAWVDPSMSGEVLIRGTMGAADWAHLAVANGLWVMLPLAAGVLVLSRRELS
jgi:hypothetical protein